MRRRTVGFVTVLLLGCPVDPLPIVGNETGNQGTSSGGSGSSSSSGGSEPVGSEGSSSGGSDPGASSSEGADVSTESGEPVGPCGSEGQCLAAVPAGWQGPVAARLDSHGEDPCTGGYDQLVQTIHAGLIAPPPVCECSCDPSGVASCATYARVHRYGGNACSGSDTANNVTATCNAAIDMAAGGDYMVEPVQVVGVTCEPQQSETIEPARFDRHHELCAVAEAVSCGDAGQCAPALPSGAELCIFAEGDLACPEGWTDHRVLEFTDIDDPRGCGTCKCLPHEGTCSGHTVYLFGPNDCGGSPVGGASPGSGCEELGSQGSGSARLSGVGVPSPADCSGNADPDPPVNSASATDPYTVCCSVAPPGA